MQLEYDYAASSFRCALLVLVVDGYHLGVSYLLIFFFFFQAEDGIRDLTVTGVQTCALPISHLERTISARRYAGIPGYERDDLPRPEEAAVADVADDSRQRMAHRADEVQDCVGLPRRRPAALGRDRSDARHARRRVRGHGQPRGGPPARGRTRGRSRQGVRRPAQDSSGGQTVPPPRLDDAGAPLCAR